MTPAGKSTAADKGRNGTEGAAPAQASNGVLSVDSFGAAPPSPLQTKSGIAEAVLHVPVVVAAPAQPEQSSAAQAVEAQAAPEPALHRRKPSTDAVTGAIETSLPPNGQTPAPSAALASTTAAAEPPQPAGTRGLQQAASAQPADEPAARVPVQLAADREGSAAAVELAPPSNAIAVASLLSGKAGKLPAGLPRTASSEAGASSAAIAAAKGAPVASKVETHRDAHLARQMSGDFRAEALGLRRRPSREVTPTARSGSQTPRARQAAAKGAGRGAGGGKGRGKGRGKAANALDAVAAGPASGEEAVARPAGNSVQQSGDGAVEQAAQADGGESEPVTEADDAKGAAHASGKAEQNGEAALDTVAAGEPKAQPTLSAEPAASAGATESAEPSAKATRGGGGRRGRGRGGSRGRGARASVKSEERTTVVGDAEADAAPAGAEARAAAEPPEQPRAQSEGQSGELRSASAEPAPCASCEAQPGPSSRTAGTGAKRGAKAAQGAARGGKAGRSAPNLTGAQKADATPWEEIAGIRVAEIDDKPLQQVKHVRILRLFHFALLRLQTSGRRFACSPVAYLRIRVLDSPVQICPVCVNHQIVSQRDIVSTEQPAYWPMYTFACWSILCLFRMSPVLLMPG
jgi:trimeric autotransporter adhesin